MELQTKFIDGTCRQYSIREDGAVFRNYVTKVIEGKEYAVYKNRTRRKTPGNCITLSNYKIGTSLKILIFIASLKRCFQLAQQQPINSFVF